MPDAIFEHPRLVAIYDALDADRRDLDAYAAMVDEFTPEAVVDLGCGTGLLARRLARSGIAVTGVDPAAGSLKYAQTQPGARHVRWILGGASALPRNAVDLALMTGNAAQAVVGPADWDDLLRHVHAALRPGGRFVFETRDPSRRAWEHWTKAESLRRVDIEGVGWVETWVELTVEDLPLISFRHTWVFEADGAVLTSDSTLRFRDRAEVEHDLRRHGFAVDEVRDAPDRPTLQFVFLASRTPTSHSNGDAQTSRPIAQRLDERRFPAGVVVVVRIARACSREPVLEPLVVGDQLWLGTKPVAESDGALPVGVRPSAACAGSPAGWGSLKLDPPGEVMTLAGWPHVGERVMRDAAFVHVPDIRGAVHDGSATSEQFCIADQISSRGAEERRGLL